MTISLEVPSWTIQSDYEKKFAASGPIAKRAREVFPNGVTHDLRHMEPFPVAIDRQLGAYKWDVSGNRFVDYWAGHGSLILGHSHPKVVDAVQKQMAKMTHAGGSHPLELEWAELVLKLIPSIEQMRFTASGTEATLMALRIARIATGRPKFLKFVGHFHGWHDAVVPTAYPPYDDASASGVIDGVAANTVAIRPNDVELLENTLRKDPQIGAVILEPTGGHWGAVPIRGDFLKRVRELTTRYGQVLIFDEVISGFRVAPGGAQEVYGIRPDLTTLAKILAGGLPGGAVGGRADLMQWLDFKNGKAKMRHPGTYNGNPLSAAAGIATLTEIATGEPCRKANEIAREIRNRANRMFEEQGWNWVAYGDFSMFHLLANYSGPRPEASSGDNDGFVPYGGELDRLDGPKSAKMAHTFRQAMLLNGVDIPGMAGWVTAAHTLDDVEKTVAALRATIQSMQTEGFAI